MSNLVTWLLTLISPILIRAVSALGFSAVVFVGVEALVQQLITSAQNSWTTMPVAVLQLASVGGLPEALGMVAGAYMGVFSAKFALAAYKMIFAPKASSIWGQM